VKAGSLLLMQETMQHLDRADDADTLEVHVYTGADGSFDYYEDDGDTYAFQQGASVERKFSILGNSLEVSAAQGGYLSRYKHWDIYFHGVKPESVKVNGAAVSTETSNYRFVEPVSDFDPYHVPPKDPVQISGIRSVKIAASTGAVKIEW
jgi:alpha-glucosidase (family GH31 glycosyl hydrolase)